jgi:uncharacterized protein YkwD
MGSNAFNDSYNSGGKKAGTYPLGSGTIAFIDKLPLSQPVGQAAAYNDLKGKALVVSFGSITCGICTSMAANAEKFINNNNAGGKVLFLYFHMDEPLVNVEAYQKTQAYKNVSFYRTGYDAMSALDKAFPLVAGTTLPFIWYIDPSGKVVSTSKGKEVTVMENFIKSNLTGTTTPATQNPDQPALLGLRFTSAKADAEKITGKPFRSVTDGSGEWCFYGTYAKFTMLRFIGGKLDYIYTNAPGSSIPAAASPLKDKNDRDKIYAYQQGSIANLTISAGANEQIIFELTNAFRAFNGKPAFKWDDRLADAARKHSKDMHDRGFFSHDTPQGVTPYQRMTSAGYNFRSAAENIACGSPNGINMVHIWINSAGHRENTLGQQTEIGVGWFSGTQGDKTYGTQKFATPR